MIASQNKDDEKDQHAGQAFVSFSNVSTASASLLLHEISSQLDEGPFKPQLIMCTSAEYDLSPNILVDMPITENMRARLRASLMEETTRQKFTRQTYVTAVTYLDLYLQKKGRISVNQFQTLGLSCLIIATKFIESKVPVISLTTFNLKQLLNFEKNICKKLNFFLSPDTYYSFACRLIEAWDDHIEVNPTFGIKFFKQADGVNWKLRAFFEKLDCLYMNLQTYRFLKEDIVVNLFYIEHKKLSLMVDDQPIKYTPEQLEATFYTPDSFYYFYQEFITSVGNNSLSLSLETGKFLLPVLSLRTNKSNEESMVELFRQKQIIQSYNCESYSRVKKAAPKIAKVK